MKAIKLSVPCKWYCVPVLLSTGGRLQGLSHIKARLGRSAVWLLLLF